MDAARPLDMFLSSGTAVAATELATFASGIRGDVILPGDERYEDARLVHNRVYDRRPAVIVRAADAEDVAHAVGFARGMDLQIAVRSGGHSLAGFGTGDDVLVIDLSSMKGLHIDPERRVAWAQPGLTAGEYTTAAAAHGLATPFGDAASVGLGGLVTGGGIGWLTRKHGLTIDSLLAAEVVTADGRRVIASHAENPDLFWAIRGGGGNVGIVTRFQFRLHPVDVVIGGALFLPPTPEIVRGVIDAAKAAPDELTTINMIMRVPPLPMIAAEHHGKVSVLVLPVFAGDLMAGQAAMAPFRALAEPIADLVGPMPYVGMYALSDGATAPHAGVTRSMFADDLDDASIAAILEFVETSPTPLAIGQIRILGGEMARIGNDATAFAHRDRSVMFAAIVPFEDPSRVEEMTAWTDQFFAAVRHDARGVYANFLAEDGEARIHEAYPAETYRRLAEIKRRYDPANVFHLNQNIRPARIGA